jgi:hypothetical protein
MRVEAQPRSGLRGGKHHGLASLADRQHGVVSIRQLIGPLGYSEAAVSRAVRDRYLHRVHRGVYAVGRRTVSRDGECLAAVLAYGPHALLSYRSAAWLWGIARSYSGCIEVTSPTPRHARPPVRLTHADRALVKNIPVTALPRTLLDYAGTVRFYLLQLALERSEELGAFDLVAVDELLGRTVGHPGHGRLRRALELYRPAPFTRSGLERRFLELVEQAGLPQSVTGFNELGHELDVYWPQYGLVVELDLYETHGTREAFERDRLRQEDLLLVGIRMTRVTGPRLAREPRRVIDRVARLLAQGGWVRR